MVRDGKTNGNWKGGISLIKTADATLTLSKDVRNDLKKRIILGTIEDTVSGCLNWDKGVFQSTGRACLSLGKNRHLVARLSFVLFSEKPIGAMSVLHSCDNKLCVNPKHLFLGTPKDNSQDMVSKGRQAYGEKNGRSILTEKEVIEIDGRLKSGSTKAHLAREFGVSWTAIQYIEKRKSWRHLFDD